MSLDHDSTPMSAARLAAEKYFAPAPAAPAANRPVVVYRRRLSIASGAAPDGQEAPAGMADAPSPGTVGAPSTGTPSAGRAGTPSTGAAGAPPVGLAAVPLPDGAAAPPLPGTATTAPDGMTAEPSAGPVAGPRADTAQAPLMPPPSTAMPAAPALPTVAPAPRPTRVHLVESASAASGGTADKPSADTDSPARMDDGLRREATPVVPRRRRRLSPDRAPRLIRHVVLKPAADAAAQAAPASAAALADLVPPPADAATGYRAVSEQLQRLRAIAEQLRRASDFDPLPRRRPTGRR